VTVGRYILLGSGLLTWGGLAWMGMGRFDTGAHFTYYEAIPAIMLVATTLPAVALWTLLRRSNWSWLGSLWLSLGLIALLPYLFFYTGGM